MPAGAAPCAGRLADMTRDARLAMDAGNNDRLASIPNKKQTSVFGEDIMKHWLIGMLLLTGPSAFAQQAVPTIGFDSIPNPLRLPPNLYFGEVSGVSVNSKGHVFVLSRGNTTGPAYAAAATQLLEFDAKGAYVREIGKNLYAWSFGHTVKVDPADNIWVTDKGSDMVIKFDPEGRVVMVFGRKQEASDAAATRRGWPVSPGHRRGMGQSRQHLHQRRLYQLARRQGRQERQLAEIMGRPRQGARPVQYRGAGTAGRQARDRQNSRRGDDSRRDLCAGLAMVAVHHAAAQSGAL